MQKGGFSIMFSSILPVYRLIQKKRLGMNLKPIKLLRNYLYEDAAPNMIYKAINAQDWREDCAELAFANRLYLHQYHTSFLLKGSMNLFR